MNDLFRFLVLRAPLPPADGTIELGQGDSRFIAELAVAQRGEQPQQEMRRLATAFTRSQAFVTDIDSLDIGPQLAAFRAALDDHPEADLAGLRAALETIADQDPAQFASSGRFVEAWDRVRDSLVAIKLVPEIGTTIAAPLVDATRMMGLVRRVARNDRDLDAKGAVAAARAALLVLPATAVLPPLPSTAPTAPPLDVVSEAERASLATHLSELLTAVDMVRAIRSDLVVDEPVPADEPSHGVQPSADDERGLSQARRSRRTPETLPPVDLGPSRAFLTRAHFEAMPASASRILGFTGGNVPTLTPRQADGTLMQTYNLELTKSVDALIDIDITPLFPSRPALNIKPVFLPGEPDEAADPPPAKMTDVPKTHGTITPAGIGDLLVTRQHTVRYEMGELAHVENIAQGEKLTRMTRRRDTTETTEIQETESFREDQRDLQTTDRFTLHQEADRVVKSDHQRIPGQPSSDSYGSLVESGGSKQSSQKEAETYSRDVTQRAASRITQRTRTQITTRTLRELEDQATHTFEGGAIAEVVIYQWIDQIVEAQVFSYGKRLFYDIVVPEPGAFLTRALESRPRELPLPPRPAPFQLEPTHLNERNWAYYVAGYGASGVAPPPPPEVTVARTFQGSAQNMFSPSDELRFATASTGIEVTIPDGYRAASTRVRVRWSSWGGHIDLVVGFAHHRFVYVGPAQSWSWEANLDWQTGSIPITVMSPEGHSQFTIAIEILCELTPERMERWQSAAYAAILAASRDRLGEYEQRLMNLRAGLRLLTSGQSADRKQQMIRHEIQKACLSVITDQHFDGLSAVGHSPQGYPQPFLPNIEPYGRYLRFLEHAFEWRQMTWRYAPYFWGRKPYWVRTLLRDDPDPAFADLLQAGAARALVPVRPGFEASVLSFMTDGTVPTLDALTEITSPLYLPLLAELRDPDRALEAGLPYGDPWELRLPTTLVALRRDGTLPRWAQQTAADGTVSWVTKPGDPVP